MLFDRAIMIQGGELTSTHKLLLHGVWQVSHRY